MGTTVLTLIFANSKWGSFLNDIFSQPIYIGIGSLQVNFTPHLLINDGFMTLFFLVVGMELKREILVGELSSMRDAGLPVFAALGGMLVPALIYYSINREGLAARGWGIAMATDIAFAVGILVLLNQGGTRHPIPYIIGGLLLWLSMLQSGIHATLAGVLLAFTIPARSAFTLNQFEKRLVQLHGLFGAETANLNTQDCLNTPDCLLSNPCMYTIAQGVKDAAKAVQSPLQRMEHALSPWVTFGCI
jgi:NhaA family Na+:H+ antiporter